MKVVSSKQMAYIESQSYRNGASEEAYMDAAGKGVAHMAESFLEKHRLPKRVYLLCGKGNNAGDAYVAGIELLAKGCSVLAYQLVPASECSPLCQKNLAGFLEAGGNVHEVNNVQEEVTFHEPGIILDALFGTGFHGIARDPYATTIRLANKSSLPILAIDIPSGLDGDTGIVEGEAIQAAETIFLGLPKTGFFLQDGWNHVGKLRYVDFGLPPSYVEESECDMQMLTHTLVMPLLPKVINNRHKYQAGFVVGLAGSPGMPGAALLSSAGALCGGAGIVKLLHPKGMEGELSSSPWELIKVPYETGGVTPILELMDKANALFIGPGLGRSVEAGKLLGAILPKIHKPCVIDADALTLIAENKIPLPEQAILTPHVGEMIRLLKRSAPKPGTQEFLATCQEYAEKHRITLVLKGGPSFIFHANEIIAVNPCGDPGMATAGSGDVLTGLVAALLAQGVSPHSAAMLGVYLHGTAGEYAAEEMTSYCMTASDILTHLPDAFRLC